VDQQDQSRWRLTRWQLLWGVAAWALVFIIVICGYLFGWKWTGFSDRTLWDWLKLLLAVAVPAVLAYFGQRISSLQYLGQQEAEDKRAQDEALQAYLDQIGQLLLDKDRPLRQSKEGDEVRTLARARTLTVLARLEGGRKGNVVRFLFESGLITQPALILDLAGADLKAANLGWADLNLAVLRGSNLQQAYLRGAKLRKADLSLTMLYRADLNKADLGGARLSEAFLSGADLSRTNLYGAHLRGADLRGANLNEADLHWADLNEADLRGVRLSKAVLREVNLRGTNLTGAFGVTYEELEQQAASLAGATMPNGQKYEGWLKSKGCGEDGENSGP
jgi:uncharacterized protein YjbI with pentapeptide repeats